MRLILSRKGMDSSIGGIASPILPDGTFRSLPIPEVEPHTAAKGTPYSRIRAGDSDLGSLVSQLTRGRKPPGTFAHLDPDLDPRSIDREPGWLPTFGQAGAAESHLVSAGVGPGDVFLFFGWFRRTIWVNDQLHFEPGAPNIHALFGWLQVGRRLSLTGGEAPPSWALQHPHCRGEERYASQDSLYMATEYLDLPGITAGSLPGGGFGARYCDELRLTAPGENRSVWLLPKFFHKAPCELALTYHSRSDRWQIRPEWPEQVLLKTVGRGQEFVLELPDSLEAVSWLAGKLRALAGIPAAYP